MEATKIINTNSPTQVRTAGLEALKKELGVIGTVRFLQQYDEGYGDYTTDKYSIEDEDLDSICNQLG